MTFPFVVIEGLDGSGKTTLRKGLFRLVKLLAGGDCLDILTTNYLLPDRVAALVAGKYDSQPGEVDEYLDALVADKLATQAQLLEPALRTRPVLADRWLLSELSFFAAKHQMGPDETYRRFGEALTRAADMTLVLTVPMEVSMDRAGRRPGEATRADWDVTDVQSAVALTLSEVIGRPSDFPLLGKVVELDASRTPADVLRQAWDALADERLMWTP